MAATYATRAWQGITHDAATRHGVTQNDRVAFASPAATGRTPFSRRATGPQSAGEGRWRGPCGQVQCIYQVCTRHGSVRHLQRPHSGAEHEGPSVENWEGPSVESEPPNVAVLPRFGLPISHFRPISTKTEIGSEMGNANFQLRAWASWGIPVPTVVQLYSEMPEKTLRKTQKPKNGTTH